MKSENGERGRERKEITRRKTEARNGKRKGGGFYHSTVIYIKKKGGEKREKQSRGK